MPVTLTLTVTDLERKAISFCKEKEITFPIARLLVDFAEEVTKDLQEKNKQLEELLTEQYPDLKQSLDWANEREKKLLEDLGHKKIAIQTRKARIKELEKQIEKMKCCHNCKNWNWKHSRCEKKLQGDCFKASKWEYAEK